MELFPHCHMANQLFAKMRYKRPWKRSLGCLKKILLHGVVSLSCPIVIGPAGGGKPGICLPHPNIFGKNQNVRTKEIYQIPIQKIKVGFLNLAPFLL
jgi:hypothetical protein